MEKIVFYQQTCSFGSTVKDVHEGVKTRSKYKEQKLVSKRDYDQYFIEKNKKDIEQRETADDSEVFILKESDNFYLKQSVPWVP